MGKYSPVRALMSEWGCYLEQHGHDVLPSGRSTDIMISRNGRKGRYRWLFALTRGAARRLTAAEHERLERELRSARRAREKVYLVVKFERPVARVLVLPAEKAAKAGRLVSDKAGIPWEG